MRSANAKPLEDYTTPAARRSAQGTGPGLARRVRETEPPGLVRALGMALRPSGEGRAHLGQPDDVAKASAVEEMAIVARLPGVGGGQGGAPPMISARPTM